MVLNSPLIWRSDRKGLFIVGEEPSRKRSISGS